MTRPSPLALVLREALEHDADEIVAIESAAFGDAAWTRSQVLGSLGGGHAFALIAHGIDQGTGKDTDPAHPLAWAAFHRVMDEAELLRVATRPGARRRGVARALLEMAFVRLGTSRCVLEVRADNHPAQALYRDLGFTPCGRRARYYDDHSDALIMRRDSGCPEPDAGVC